MRHYRTKQPEGLTIRLAVVLLPSLVSDINILNSLVFSLVVENMIHSLK